MKKVRFQKPKVSFKDVVIIFFGVLFVVGFGFLLQFSMKENVDVKKQSPEKLEKLDAVVKKEDSVERLKKTIKSQNAFENDFITEDFTIGDKNAPVQVLMYGDFTCHHCRRFITENFDKLLTKYIIPGKVLFIFRPIITNLQSLRGTEVLLCEHRTDMENVDIFNKLYREKWSFKKDYLNELMEILDSAKMMKKSKFQKCISSTKLQDMVVNKTNVAVEELKINSTPQVFVNKNSVFADGSVFNAIDLELLKVGK